MSETKFCVKCGKEIEDNCVSCPNCGHQVANNQNASMPNIIINNSANANATATAINNGGNGVSQKSKIVTLILAIVLGWIGGHRFYVGKIGTGIIWFFTVGFFGIGWILDIIKVLSGTFKDGAGLVISQ